MDREPDRIEELEAALLKEQQARGAAEKRIEKLEMQVHQYNRRVGWPRYPLKGE